MEPSYVLLLYINQLGVDQATPLYMSYVQTEVKVGHGHVTQALRKLGTYVLWENVHALTWPSIFVHYCHVAGVSNIIIIQ